MANPHLLNPPRRFYSMPNTPKASCGVGARSLPSRILLWPVHTPRRAIMVFSGARGGHVASNRPELDL